MNVTIKTLTVQVGSKETPLTKAMVHQLPYLEAEFANNQLYKEGGTCQILGEVSMPDYTAIIVATPNGLQRANGMRYAFDELLKAQGKRLERLILLK